MSNRYLGLDTPAFKAAFLGSRSESELVYISSVTFAQAVSAVCADGYSTPLRAIAISVVNRVVDPSMAAEQLAARMASSAIGSFDGSIASACSYHSTTDVAIVSNSGSAVNLRMLCTELNKFGRYSRETINRVAIQTFADLLGLGESEAVSDLMTRAIFASTIAVNVVTDETLHIRGGEHRWVTELTSAMGVELLVLSRMFESGTIR